MVGCREHRVSRNRYQPFDLSVSRGIDLFSQCDDWKLSPEFWKLADAASPTIEMARREKFEQVDGRRCKHHATRFIETSGKDIDDICKPGGKTAKLLCADADPGVED